MDMANDAWEFPRVDEPAWRLNRHLWDSYVPDAHPVQVLTRSHLDKATDLSRWQVRALAGDRYLVETHDLAPWLDPETPADEVLLPARADFGAMILTAEVIANDPYGWISGRGLRSRD